MSSIPSRTRSSVLLSAGLITLELVGLFLFRHHPVAALMVEFVFVILANALVLTVAIQRILSAVSLRRYWILIGASYLLCLLAYLIRAWVYSKAVMFYGGVVPWADFTDLIMIFSLVPQVILFSQGSGRFYRNSFFWIDTLQTMVLGYLIYLKLFSVIPFTGTVIHPLDLHQLLEFYLTADFLLPCFFFLRYLAAITADDRRFYGALVWATGISAMMFLISNTVANGEGNAAYTDVLVPAASLFIFILFLSLPAETTEGADSLITPGWISKTLNIVCPAFLTLALIGLGIDTSRRFFRFGWAAVATAFTLHLLRATILQLRIENSEQSLMDARNQLEVMTMTDSLTGVANRRCFDKTYANEWNRAVRTCEPLALLMMDIDFFKTLNDRYGHQAGDECLVRVAKALQRCLPRSGDLLARYGGEEFAVILPTTHAEGAYVVAAKMQEAVAALLIENETSIGYHPSISIGIAVATFPTDSTAAQHLEAADRALYLAKDNGRNRLEMTPCPKLVANRLA